MDAQQLATVENLCETLYNSSDENARSSAQQQLLSLQSSPEYIPQCQYILDNSSNAYALLLASTSLTRLITTHWNNFTTPQRVDIRNYILGYLATNGPHLADYVITSLVQLLCRITKLGWFDDTAHRELVEETLKFLQATIDHYIIGLRILNELVVELNIPTSGRTLPQHRKTAVSFRDTSLLRVFQISLTAMKQLQMRAITGATPAQEVAMGEHALGLCKRCLDYDFIGTNPDESAEDVGTVQIPSSWRDLIVDGSTLTLLFDFYKTTEPPRSSLAMQCVVLLSSVRRSLFSKEPDRAAYLQLLMNFIREIVGSQKGLEHQENYHEFCRQLGRLKANYQLSELVRVDGYVEWIELAANFTVKSFQNWQWSTNSIHYLLALWGRLVAAVPYVRADVGAKNHTLRLQECVLEVVRSYVQSMVDSVEAVLLSDGALDDPLDDEGSLREQLDRLPVITRFEYPPAGQFLISLMDPCLKTYEEALQAVAAAGGVLPGAAMKQLEVLEGKLTWLVYICGAVVGGYSWSDASTSDGVEAIDASLCRRVFQLAQGIDFRLSSTGGQGKCSPRLEQALIYFFQTFRRMYMWEQHGLTSTAAFTGIMMVGGIDKGDFAPSVKQKVFQRFFEGMGMGDHSTVVNIIITKIGNNLKYWSHDSEVIGQTLQLFLDMASSYSSSRMLLDLDTVKFLVQHHTGEHFAFLLVPANTRQRTVFHTTLARLIFSTMEDMNALFDAFMKPILTVLTQLGSAQPFRQEDVKQALIGVCRDLRGIAAATNNRRAYTLLFEALYPQHFPVFVRAAEEWSDSPEVATALLKFMQEFVYNKAQRLVFDQSSPNGILLFRETSKIVCAYGQRLAASPASTSDVYKEKYKGVCMVLSVLTTALNGTYVNFGVFALYNDSALDSALETALKLALQIPLPDVMAYPKLCKTYFYFFEVLFRNHIGVVLRLDAPVFSQILRAVHDGLSSLDAPMASQCAAIIDHLATFQFQKGGQGQRQEVQALKAHLMANPNLFSQLLGTLFNILLFDSALNQTANQWAVTRPILSLMLADESAFNAYKEHLISSQSPENSARLGECFNKLMSDVQRNLENTNRDRFTQRLTSFRLSSRQFLTM